VRDDYAEVSGRRVSRMLRRRRGTGGRELRCDERRNHDAAENHERGHAPTPQ